MEVVLNFDYTNPEEGNFNTNVIFYSPALDNKIYPITHDNNEWIDISTDWLIYNEYKEQQYIKPNISQIELFLTAEIERQIKLTNDEKFIEFINKKIKIPTELRIQSVMIDFPEKIERSSVSNVPFAYRDYYDLLMNMRSEQLQKYVSAEYQLQQKRTVDDDVNPFTRKKCYLTFLNHLLKNIYYHLDRTNAFLEEGEINIGQDILLKEDFEDAVILLIMNMNLINSPELIIEFINYVKELIFSSKVEFSAMEISWTIEKHKIKRLIELKDQYLGQLTNFVYGQVPISFIAYNWKGISTGERAMLNLYSRFYYAKKKLERTIKTSKAEKLPYHSHEIPDVVYVLIDEGELGFHLQWQKEYINDLVRILPFTLIFKKNGKDFIPQIQIIFSTHSTLALSDIPHENINYLIKDKDGLAKVLLDDNKPKQSFGANVHVLMSDSFFLRDGLVGSFATEKINKAISLINQKIINEDERNYINSVINIIDEPLLKRKLVSMYENKHTQISELERLRKLSKELNDKINLLEGKDDTD